jgi:hypothetical protein
MIWAILGSSMYTYCTRYLSTSLTRVSLAPWLLGSGQNFPNSLPLLVNHFLKAWSDSDDVLPRQFAAELGLGHLPVKRQRKFSTSIRSTPNGSTCENRTYRPSGERLRPVCGKYLMSKTFSAVPLVKLKNFNEFPLIHPA